MPTDRRENDVQVLESFIGVFCRKNHDTPKGRLCVDCADLLDYAKNRLDKCPYDPKPKCKDCLTHCYRPDYRQRIREVMKFSGMYFVKRGRIDWLWRYFR